jgi:hypothetical protein
MGAAASHRRKFLEEHSVCAFCGGVTPATTIEHCPPRAMFQFRHWPDGFEFPSCESCNAGSSDEDLLVAVLARMDPFHDRGDLDGRHRGLMQAVNKQFPGFFERMMPSPGEARRANRDHGIVPQPGQTHQEAGPVKVPEELHHAVCVFARKLVKGIYYQDAMTPFPNDGCLLLNWFTNADLLHAGRYPVFEQLQPLAGNAPLLKRSGRLLNDQFEYKLSTAPDRSILVLQARFGFAFGLVVFGSTQSGFLEDIVSRNRTETGRPGPFAVLQSPSLAA